MEKNDVIRRLLKDRTARTATARQSHKFFFGMYLKHYIKYPSAPFHDEIFSMTEDQSLPLAAIVAFRGSGKSTIVSLSYVLWAIMGCQQAKFVLLIGQTQEQARQLLRNIRAELETNENLRSDLGPFHEEENE